MLLLLHPVLLVASGAYPASHPGLGVGGAAGDPARLPRRPLRHRDRGDLAPAQAAADPLRGLAGRARRPRRDGGGRGHLARLPRRAPGRGSGHARGGGRLRRHLRGRLPPVPAHPSAPAPAQALGGGLERRRTRRRAHHPPAPRRATPGSPSSPGSSPGSTLGPRRSTWSSAHLHRLGRGRPPGGEIAFTIRNLGDWSGKRVPALRPGARAWIDGPYGAFSIDRDEGPGFVLVAGGVGITPMVAILSTMASRGDVRPVLLFYGARAEEDLTLRSTVEALGSKARPPGRLRPRAPSERDGRGRRASSARTCCAATCRPSPPLPVLHLRAAAPHGRHGTRAAFARSAAGADPRRAVRHGLGSLAMNHRIVSAVIGLVLALFLG